MRAPGYTVYLNEKSPTNAYVTHVYAKDDDVEEYNRNFGFRIAEDMGDVPFEISEDGMIGAIS